MLLTTVVPVNENFNILVETTFSYLRSTGQIIQERCVYIGAAYIFKLLLCGASVHEVAVTVRHLCRDC